MSAWTFDFVGGIQGPVPKIGDANGFPAAAWAVRSGDVNVVPIPAAIWLLGSALLGLFGIRRFT